MISIRPAIAVIAATTSGATAKPSWAAKRAARIIRSGSSEKESSGVPGVRSTRSARSTIAAERDRRTRGSGTRTAIELTREVAATEVALEGVAEVDVGLARVGVVGLGAVGRDLHLPRSLAAADRAEVAAHVPDRRRPSRRRSRSVTSGRAEVVKSRSFWSRPIIASRTGPPTSASSSPASAKRAPSSSMTDPMRSSSAPTRRWISTIGRGGRAASDTTGQSTCRPRPYPATGDGCEQRESGAAPGPVN